MTDLNALAVFAKVIEFNSFSEAARRLGMPVSTVSRKVSDLEDRLGVRLLERSTRKLRLTDLGADILDHARQSAELIDAVDEIISNQLGEVRGLLRLSAPPSISDTILAPVTIAFLAAYPQAKIQINVTDRYIDHISDGVDIAFRVGRDLPDSSLIARTLLHYRHRLVASPAYIAQFGEPTSPDELLNHRLMSWSAYARTHSWTFVSAESSKTISFEPSLKMNDYAGLATALCTGGGVGDLPPVVAPSFIKDGSLVEVMTDWRFRPVDLSIVHLGNRHMPRIVRLFKEFAIETIPALFNSLPA